jgi:hypothetical protein
MSVGEVAYYLKVAIEINKKVGGTRGYGTNHNKKRHKPTAVIDFS